MKTNTTTLLQTFNANTAEIKIINCDYYYSDIITFALRKYLFTKSPSFGLVGIKSENIINLVAAPNFIKEDIFTLIKNLKQIKFVLDKNTVNTSQFEVVLEGEGEIKLSSIKSHIPLYIEKDETIVTFSAPNKIILLFGLGNGFHSAKQNDSIFNLINQNFLPVETFFSNATLISNFIEEEKNLYLTINSFNGCSPVELFNCFCEDTSLFFKTVQIDEEMSKNLNILSITKEKIYNLELLFNQGRITRKIFDKLNKIGINNVQDLSFKKKFQILELLTVRETAVVENLLKEYDLNFLSANTNINDV